MTSPKMMQLQRQLMKGSAVPSVAAPTGDSSNLFMEAMEESVARIANQRIEVAKEMQKKAENECAELRKEMASIRKEAAQVQKEMQAKIDNMNSAHKSIMDGMRNSHSAEMKRMQQSLETIQAELAKERVDRTGMEAKHEVMEKMYEKMERMMANMKVATPPPVVQNAVPAAAPMKPVTVVHERDGSGRILKSTFMPST